jgi:hypothetical protein
MSLKRFKQLSSCLRLDNYSYKNMKESRYRPITRFIKAFNKRRVKIICPGKKITVDECMSSWKGVETVLKDHQSSAHMVKVKHKPKGVGMELKSSADGQTGLLLRLEL